MRSPEDVFADIESDRLGREAELRLIEGILNKSDKEEEERVLRRSMIVLAYSHLEGFCKFSLLAYAGAINSYKLSCAAAAIPLVAASLGDVFSALRNDQKKHELFRRALKEDTEVHRIAREQVFVESYEDKVMSQVVEISDRMVDTKANLNSVILKRNLFMLGLPHPFVDQFSGSMDRLLGHRNRIAHGDALLDPKPELVVTYLADVFKIMAIVQAQVYDALVNKAYLRTDDNRDAA